MAKIRYKILVNLPKELYNFSYLFTGLYELKKEKIIDLSFRWRYVKNKKRIIVKKDGEIIIDKHNNPKLTYFSLLDRKTNIKTNFSIDLSDNSSVYSINAFNKSDFVFKRSFDKKNNKYLSTEHNKKLHNLGITISTLPDNLSLYYKLILIYGVFINCFLDYLKLDRNLIKRIHVFKKKIISLKKINNIRPLSMFMKPIEVKETSNKIFYQKRCFPHEPNEDIKDLHRQRYEIVKLLKNKYPDNFYGGLSSSKIVMEKFSDAITNLSSNTREFIKSVEKCDITIYTRGISDSIGFTLPEFFSQGKVVISERIKNNIPIDICDGKEVVFFDDDDSLIDAINNILSNPSKMNTLKESGRLYFENHVDPKQNMRRILKIMGCEI